VRRGDAPAGDVLGTDTNEAVSNFSGPSWQLKRAGAREVRLWVPKTRPGPSPAALPERQVRCDGSPELRDPRE
jgi:hypothetical protein